MERGDFNKRSRIVWTAFGAFRNSFYSSANEVVDIIESLYHERANFTKENLEKENEIPLQLSALEKKIKTMPIGYALRREGIKKEEVITGLNHDVETIRDQHHDFKEQYIQNLEARFETLCKEIETSDNAETIKRKNGILRDIVASYTLFKSEVIDNDARFEIKSNKTIERYTNLLKDQEKFEEKIKGIIEEYKSIDSVADYDDICRKVEISKRDQQIRLKKHTKRKSKIFCDKGSELLERFEFELENFEKSRYLEKKSEIEKDRVSCEKLVEQVEFADKEQMQELLKQYDNLSEEKHLTFENILFLHQSSIEYKTAQTKLSGQMRKHTERCLERPDELELTYDLEIDETLVREYIKSLNTKSRINIQFLLLGKSKLVEKAEEELDSAKKAAEKKLAFFYNTQKEIKEVDKETEKYNIAMTKRDTSIAIEKPSRDYALRSLDNRYLSAVVSRYVKTVRRYIERRDHWIKEDRDKDFEERLERFKAKEHIEKLRAQLDEKTAEIGVLEKRDTEAAERFDLDDYVKNHVSTPGDSRLDKMSMIISGDSRSFQGKVMRIGERLLSPEFQELIESYIEDPKHNYNFDREFRKGLALGIVKAIESPGEIADGIAAGVYESEKFYDLARTISCSD